MPKIQKRLPEKSAKKVRAVPSTGFSRIVNKMPHKSPISPAKRVYNGVKKVVKWVVWAARMKKANWTLKKIIKNQKKK